MDLQAQALAVEARTVTMLAVPGRTGTSPGGHRSIGGSARDLGHAATIALLLVVWAVPMTRSAGGQGGWAVTLGLAAAVPAVLAGRPWISLPRLDIVLALALPAAAALVCVTAPTGWDGLDETASLALASASYLAVRSWATSRRRRLVVLALVCFAGLDQFWQAYLAWWGGGVVERRMVGTFAWHNQYAAFVLAIGLMAAVLAIRGRGWWRWLGWVTAVPLLASLAFASSRASIGIAVLLWSCIVAICLRDRVGRLAAAGLVVVVVALASLMASPLLMEDSGTIGSTVAAREASQSTLGNGNARITLWSASVRLGLEYPVTGAGFDSFSGGGAARMPAAAGLSAYVHNGYLQAFSDGGAVLVTAVALTTLLPTGAALLGAVRRGVRPAEPVRLAVAVGLAASVLHSGVDFDWTYPSFLVLFAVLAAIRPPLPRAVRPLGGPAGRRFAGAGTCAAVVGMLVLSLPLSVRGASVTWPGLEVPRWAALVGAGLEEGDHTVLAGATTCRRALESSDPVLRSSALSCSADMDDVDPLMALFRARAEVRSGDTAGLPRAERTIAAWGDRRPVLRFWHAVVLAEAGRHDRATLVMDGLRAELAARGMTPQQVAVDRGIMVLDSAWAEHYRAGASPPILPATGSSDETARLGDVRREQS